MAINIEKRTRAAVGSDWGDWAETNDPAPYTNTDIVEYRVKSDYSLDIEEITEVDLEGNGKFDILMRALGQHIQQEFEAGRITGNMYSRAYLGAMQLAMTQAAGWVKGEKVIEQQIRKAAAEAETSEAARDVAVDTKKDKIAKSGIDLYIQDNTKDDKVAIAGYQANKANSESLYVNAQTTALQEQVVDNRKIKALNSMADTYGTFGAGGLTLSSDMWSAYFEIVSDLSTATTPVSTTVTKVT